ncbi:MAG: hypothetical protein KBT12_02995 [Bacteroidales bacterium]|nr:hypothetical protein [Candidatus Physcousia equi]
MFRNLPNDINAEVMLEAFPQDTFKLQLAGLHKRNTYYDVLDIEEHLYGANVLHIARNSLYNSLPECMFHQVDRFDNKPDGEAQARFDEELAKQKKEEENGYRFFAPIDIMLFQLRCRVRKEVLPFVQENKILEDMLTSRLTPEQRNNRFIRRSLPFVVNAKNIRGNRTLITLMLRKVFMHEGLKLQPLDEKHCFTDPAPRYHQSLGEALLDEACAGNVYEENVHSFLLHYWDEDICDEQFLNVVEEAEVYRRFVQDYFLSIEHMLLFEICADQQPLDLNVEGDNNFLGFNTTL